MSRKAQTARFELFMTRKAQTARFFAAKIFRYF